MAYGGAGDIAIFTETTAGESVPFGTTLDLNWDNPLRNDGTAFGYALGSNAIDLNESGHYMAIYNAINPSHQSYHQVLNQNLSCLHF